jgi:hypothetical protein
MAESEAAPEELSSIVNVMPAPPMPFIPADKQGIPVVMALMCYAGPAEEGQRVLAPFRALATPIVDMVRPITYPEMYPPEDNSYHPTAVARTLYLDSVDIDVAQSILDHIKSSTAMMAVTQLRVLGGAVARVPNDATAYAHRTRRVMGNVAALYANPSEASTHEAWVTGFAADLRQGEPGAYVNFILDDPNNVFHLNQNITPAN